MLILFKAKQNNLNLFVLLPYFKMKNFLFYLFIAGLLTRCSGDSVRNNNPYIPSYNFSYVINLNLNTPLTIPVNPVIVTEPTGISMIVMKITDTDYRAWNANCPNQAISSCSRLIIKEDKINAKCNCENYEYSLFTGVGSAKYTMIPYQVEVLGSDSIRIFN